MQTCQAEAENQTHSVFGIASQRLSERKFTAELTLAQSKLTLS
jgi:hypothetical protein